MQLWLGGGRIANTTKQVQENTDLLSEFKPQKFNQDANLNKDEIKVSKFRNEEHGSDYLDNNLVNDTEKNKNTATTEKLHSDKKSEEIQVRLTYLELKYLHELLEKEVRYFLPDS